MLEGEAKKQYQRDYMRKKRAVRPLLDPPIVLDPLVRPVLDPVTNSTRRAKWEELQRVVPVKRKRSSKVRSNCIGMVKPCPLCHAKDGHPSGFCHLGITGA